MHPATRKLHEGLIRLAKGVIHHWEKWLGEVSADPNYRDDSDRLATLLRGVNRVITVWLKEGPTARP